MSEGDKLWQSVLGVISQKIETTANQKATTIAAEIKRRIDQELLKEFYSQAIDNLQLIPFKAYSEKYQYEQKALSPFPTEWMQYTGGLVQDLMARNPLKDIGEAHVEIQARRGSNLAPGVQLDSKGRPQYTAGNRPTGVRGGYVNFADAFLDSEKQIRVRIWPGKTPKTIFEALPDVTRTAPRYSKKEARTFQQAGIKTRLQRFEFGGKGQAARPIFRLTMRAYRTQHIPKIINEVIGNG